MFTRIQPAGNLFRYLISAVDSMGEDREVPAKRIRGSLTSVVRMLHAQAPAGLSRSSKRKPGHRRARPQGAWIRHCQEHLVHLINCYIEPHAQIQEHLPRIVRGTEDLLLAGLPRAALAFVWYEHQQEFGTHPHGGLLRLVLPGGQPYVPNLNPKLLLYFDRLVSRRFGFVDPVDPRGQRLFYAAWASTKLCNTAEIKVACEAVQKAWDEMPRAEFTHQRVRQICEDNDLPILAAPDAAGRPQRQQADKFPHLHVPLRRQTVVVASFDRRRAICFAGPACHSDFDSDRYAARLNRLENMVDQLRISPARAYLRFEQLLNDRIAQQQQLWGKHDAAVTLDSFAMLREPSPAEREREAMKLEIRVTTALRYLERAEELQHQLDEGRIARQAAFAKALTALNPLTRWSERAYPFATEQDLLRGGAADDPELSVLLHPATAAADPFDDSLADEVVEVEFAEFRRHQRQQQQQGLAVRISVAATRWQLAESQRQRQHAQRELALQLCHVARAQLEQTRRRQQQKQRELAVRISLAASHRQLAEQQQQWQGGQRELAIQVCRAASVQFAEFRRQQQQRQRGLAVRISLTRGQQQLVAAQRQRRQQRKLALEICGSASWEQEAFRRAAQQRLEHQRQRRRERPVEVIMNSHFGEPQGASEPPGPPPTKTQPEPEPKVPPQPEIKPSRGTPLATRRSWEEYVTWVRAQVNSGGPVANSERIKRDQSEGDQRFPLPPPAKPTESPRETPPPGEPPSSGFNPEPP